MKPMTPYHPTNGYLPPTSGLPPPPGGQIKPPGSQLKPPGGQIQPPGSGLPGNRPGFVGPPAPPPEVRFPGNRPGNTFAQSIRHKKCPLLYCCFISFYLWGGDKKKVQ